jgi:hypothetical protein
MADLSAPKWRKIKKPPVSRRLKFHKHSSCGGFVFLFNRRLHDLSGFKTGCAHANASGTSVNVGADGLQIRIPAATIQIMGV